MTDKGNEPRDDIRVPCTRIVTQLKKQVHSSKTTFRTRGLQMTYFVLQYESHMLESVEDIKSLTRECFIIWISRT